jgi:hypothetical protein
LQSESGIRQRKNVHATKPKKLGKKIRQMIGKYERHAYFCSSKKSRHEQSYPQNKSQAHLATTCSMARCAFFFWGRTGLRASSEFGLGVRNWQGDKAGLTVNGG